MGAARSRNSAVGRAVFQKRVRWGCNSTSCKMRRTLRGLMASIIPSATACRAKSALDQCVMCRPLATGSRQANWIIRARWRGGNPRGTTGAVRGGQEPGEAGLFVAAAQAPDRGPIALQPRGQGRNRLTVGHGQEEARSLHLEEGQRGAPRDLLKESAIMGGQGYGTRFSTTHRAALSAGTSPSGQLTSRPVFVALLLARATRGR